MSDQYETAPNGRVRRPNSLRKVSAVKECNRLVAHIKELEEKLARAESCIPAEHKHWQALKQQEGES